MTTECSPGWPFYDGRQVHKEIDILTVALTSRAAEAQTMAVGLQYTMVRVQMKMEPYRVCFKEVWLSS